MMEPMHDDEIVEVFMVDEEDEGKGKEDEEDEEQGDKEQQERKQHEEQPGRKKFVCLVGEDHVVNEEGKCTVCENKAQVCEWCDSCQVYFASNYESVAKLHTRYLSHVHFAANPVVFDVRCNGCGRHSWSDFQIAKQKCSCGGVLEKNCPECLKWFGFKSLAAHFARSHIRENEASAVPKPHLNDKLDPPKRNREKAAEANAAKPLKKMQKKNNEKMAEEIGEKKDVTKKAAKILENSNVSPGPAENANFVDFVHSLRRDEKDASAVVEVLILGREQMLGKEFFKYVDDGLFSELEQGRPFGVKQLLRQMREEARKK